MDAIDRAIAALRTNTPTTSSGGNPFEEALAAEGITGDRAQFVRSIYSQESGSGANTRTSNAGAVGGMQIIPPTFRAVADQGWDINDPVHNARAGIRYANQMYDRAGGDMALAAAGYYGGPGGMDKARQGIAVFDPRNPNAPSTLQYGAQVASRAGRTGVAYPPEVRYPDNSGNNGTDYESLFKDLSADLPPQPKQTNYMRDLGVDALNTVVSAGEIPAGLARLVGGGGVLDAIGYDPKRTHELISTLYSDGRLQTEAEVAAAGKARAGESFMTRALGAAKDQITHPSVAVGNLLNSAPSWVIGGGIAGKIAQRTFLAATEKALASGASREMAVAAGRQAVDDIAGTLKTAASGGEALATAGQMAEQIHQEDPNGNIYAAIPAGIITGGISRGLGSIPGFGDAETALFTGSSKVGATGNRAVRAIKGLGSEGTEEALQSYQEQMWQNAATGKPLHEGAAEAAGQGFVLGGLTGSAFGFASRQHAPESSDRQGYAGGAGKGANPSEPKYAAPVQYTEQGSLDLLGGTAVPPSYRTDFSGPIQEQSSGGIQMLLDLSRRGAMPIEDADASARLARAAEDGALQRLSQTQNTNILTPEQARQQDDIPSTLFAASQQTTPAQSVIRTDGANTTYDQFREAKRKQALGQLLTPYEVQLVQQNVQAPEPTVYAPQAASQTAQQSIVTPDTIQGTRQVPTQVDAFGAPLNKPLPPVEQQPAATVREKDPAQMELIDNRGNPTYAATAAEPTRWNDVAQDAAKNFGFKLTPKKEPTVLKAVQAFDAGELSQENFELVMNTLGENKYPKAEKFLKEGLEETAAEKAATPAQETTPVQETAPEPAPATQAPDETQTAAPVDEVPASSLKTNDLIKLSKEGSLEAHPHLTAVDAEDALRQRLATTRNTLEQDRIGDYLESILDNDTKSPTEQLRLRTEKVQKEVAESNEAISRANDSEIYNKGGSTETTQTDPAVLSRLTNQMFNLMDDKLLKHMQDLGVDHVVSGLASASVKDIAANNAAQIVSRDGEFHLEVSPDLIQQRGMDYILETLHHEFGHIADSALLGGVYSTAPEMKFSVLPNGTTYGVGEVAREINAMYNSKGMFSRVFDYPLNKAYNPSNGYDSVSTAHEVFANLWAMYIDPEVNAAFKETMPISHKFMGEVFNDIKENDDDFASFSKNDFAERRRRFSDRGQNNVRPVDDFSKGKYATVQAAEVAARGNNEAASGGTVDKTAGTFSVDGKEIYSKTAPVTLADVPEFAPKSKVLTAVQDMMSGLGNKMLGVMTMRQIADRYPKVAAFQKYVAAQELMTTATKKLQSEVAEIDHLFNQFGKDDAAALKVSAVMLDATANEWHVDKAFSDEANAHIDPVKESDFNKAKAEYDSLSELQKKVYQQTKEKFAKDLAKQTELISKRIVDEYRNSLGEFVKMRTGSDVNIDEVAKVEDVEERKRIKLNTVSKADRRNLSRLWDDMDNNSYKLTESRGPYFPLMRFGDHVVVAKSADLKAAQAELDRVKAELAVINQKDEEDYTVGEFKAARDAVKKAKGLVDRLKGDDKHYLVEFFESETEANQRKKQITDLFKDDPTMEVYRELRTKHFRQLDAAPYSFIKKLEDEITKQVPATDANKIKDAVRDIYIKAMPERAALKSQLNRIRGSVTGAKVAEMRRAVIASGLRNSFNLSRMEHGTALNDALSDLRNGSTDEEKILGEEMAKRIVETMTARPEGSKLVTALSNLSYTTMLGLSPSFLVLNLSQPWTVSLPILAARHGFRTSGAEMTRATAEAASILMASYNDQKVLKFDFDLSKIADADERAFLQKLHDKGAIDVTQEHDLGAQATGQTEGWTDKLASWSSIPAHHTEVINRVATALAAYRMEKALDLKYGANNAEKYAEKIVSETHLDYTSENAPRLMRASSLGGLGKLVFQFKKYQQGMIFLTFKHAKDGFWKNTNALSPKERHEARKAFSYLMGAQIATAGIAGTPLTGVLAGAAAIIGMFKDKDEDKDYKQMMYNGIKSATNEKTADLIMRGVPAFLGVDVSNRLGMGDILNPLKFAQSGTTGQSTVANALLALAGPAASLTANYVQAIDDVQSGDMAKATRNIMPRFIQGPMDAYNMAHDGMLTKNGNRFRTPEEITAWDVALKAIGFTSTDLTNLASARNAFDTVSHDRSTYRKELISQFAKAALLNEDTSDIRDRIAAFNTRYPSEYAVRINQATLLKAIQAEKRYERDLRNGVRVQKNDRALYDKMGF